MMRPRCASGGSASLGVSPTPKTRHYVEHAGHTFEVDEFTGENAGLVVAELELAEADAPFDRPAWLGAEVTDEARYYNLALADRPYSRWTAQEKH